MAWLTSVGSYENVPSITSKATSSQLGLSNVSQQPKSRTHSCCCKEGHISANLPFECQMISGMRWNASLKNLTLIEPQAGSCARQSRNTSNATALPSVHRRRAAEGKTLLQRLQRNDWSGCRLVSCVLAVYLPYHIVSTMAFRLLQQFYSRTAKQPGPLWHPGPAPAAPLPRVSFA